MALRDLLVCSYEPSVLLPESAWYHLQTWIFHSAPFPWDNFFSFFFFWSHCAACGNLVPWPGIEPGPRAVKAQSPNHWTTREFPRQFRNTLNQHKSQVFFLSLFFKKIYLLFIYLFNFYYLAVSGLSCGMQDLHWGMWDLSLQHAGSLLRHAGYSSCGVQVFCSLVAARRLQGTWAL